MTQEMTPGEQPDPQARKQELSGAVFGNKAREHAMQRVARGRDKDERISEKGCWTIYIQNLINHDGEFHIQQQGFRWSTF